MYVKANRLPAGARDENSLCAKRIHRRCTHRYTSERSHRLARSKSAAMGECDEIKSGGEPAGYMTILRWQGTLMRPHDSLTRRDAAFALFAPAGCRNREGNTDYLTRRSSIHQGVEVLLLRYLCLSSR